LQRARTGFLRFQRARLWLYSRSSLRARSRGMPSGLLSPIFENDALTRGLGDAEARILVEWVVDQAEMLAERAGSENEAGRAVKVLCGRARAIGCFVRLWCAEENAAAAYQLAACERFPCP